MVFYQSFHRCRLYLAQFESLLLRGFPQLLLIIESDTADGMHLQVTSSILYQVMLEEGTEIPSEDVQVEDNLEVEIEIATEVTEALVEADEIAEEVIEAETAKLFQYILLKAGFAFKVLYQNTGKMCLNGRSVLAFR